MKTYRHFPKPSTEVLPGETAADLAKDLTDLASMISQFGISGVLLLMAQLAKLNGQPENAQLLEQASCEGYVNDDE